MVHYPLDTNNPFVGILNQNQNAFEIKTTGENINEDRVEYLYDNNNNSYSCLSIKSFNAYTFSFSSFQVKVTNYALQTYLFDVDSRIQFPKQWVLSGFDGKKWINVSTVADSKLATKGAIGTFSTDIVKPFSKLKITQIGPGYGATGFEELFCIANIEFHGFTGFFNELITCYRKERYLFYSLFCIFGLL